MKKSILIVLAIAIAFNVYTRKESFGFANGIEGSCENDCLKCHKVTKEESVAIIKNLLPEAEVLDVQPSQVRGLWELAVKVKDPRGNIQQGIIYMDFSKNNVIFGNIINVITKTDITAKKRDEAFRPEKIEFAKINLDRALVIGDKNAKFKVAVFSDVDWAFCKKLHLEMKKVVEKTRDIAFFIKLYPLPMHKEAFGKSKSIDCAQTLKSLDDALEGKKLPKAACKSTEIEDNVELAKRFGISGTPALVLEDGTLISGYKEADMLITLITNQKTAEK